MFSRATSKTFKPVKKAAEGSRRHKLHLHAQATLGAGNLRETVALPVGEDINDWLAVNVTDFFNEISLLYGARGLRAAARRVARRARPLRTQTCSWTRARPSRARP